MARRTSSTRTIRSGEGAASSTSAWPWSANDAAATSRARASASSEARCVGVVEASSPRAKSRNWPTIVSSWAMLRARLEVGALDPDDACRRSGAAADQHLPVVEEIELARELALAHLGEDLRLALLVEVEDLDDAFEDEKEIDAAVAAREDGGVRLELLIPPVGGDALHHGRGEARKSLRVAACRIARVALGCGCEGSVLRVSHAPSLRKRRPRASSERPTRRSSCSDELQRHAVVAVALAGRSGAVVEDVALVAFAAGAVVLGARDDHLHVGLREHCAGQ